jgi:hypothetical protein
MSTATATVDRQCSDVMEHAIGEVSGYGNGTNSFPMT